MGGTPDFSGKGMGHPPGKTSSVQPDWDCVQSIGPEPGSGCVRQPVDVGLSPAEIVQGAIDRVEELRVAVSAPKKIDFSAITRSVARR